MSLLKKYFKITVKILITVSPMRLVTRFFLKNYIDKYSNDKVLMICTGGIGDTIMSCLLIESFMSANGKQSCEYLIKYNHKDVVRYVHNDAVIHIISNRMMRMIELTYKPIKTPKHDCKSKYVYGELSIFDECRLTNDSFIEDFKNKVFGLSKTIGLKQIYDKVSTSYNSNKVLLAPQTVSLKYGRSNFWELLAIQLKNKGYEVFTNSTDKSAIKGTKCLEASLIDLVEVLSGFRVVISYRSGLNDWLEVLGVNQVILYNDERTCRYYDTRLLWDISNTKNLIIDDDIDNTITHVLQVI